LCPVTAISCAIEQFLPRIVAPVARIEDILDVNYDDLFCDYNTLTTVNSVTNTRTIQQTPMFIYHHILSYYSNLPESKLNKIVLIQGFKRIPLLAKCTRYNIL
jgi:hypothetical protein